MFGTPQLAGPKSTHRLRLEVLQTDGISMGSHMTPVYSWVNPKLRIKSQGELSLNLPRTSLSAELKHHSTRAFRQR